MLNLYVSFSEMVGYSYSLILTLIIYFIGYYVNKHCINYANKFATILQNT